jgi:hypothetical protein
VGLLAADAPDLLQYMLSLYNPIPDREIALYTAQIASVTLPVHAWKLIP